jgi:hypothetical protein
MKRPLVALTGLLLAQALAQVNLALSPTRLELVPAPWGRGHGDRPGAERPGTGRSL